MVRGIEQRRLVVRDGTRVVIRGGTHYTPVEFPAIVDDELHRLLAWVLGWELGGVQPGAGTAAAG